MQVAGAAQGNPPEAAVSQASPTWWPQLSLVLGVLIGLVLVARRLPSLGRAAAVRWCLSPTASLGLFAGMLLAGSLGALLAGKVAGIDQADESLKGSVVAGVGAVTAQLVVFAVALALGRPPTAAQPDAPVDGPANASQGAWGIASSTLLAVAAMAVMWIPLQAIGSLAAMASQWISGIDSPAIGHHSLELLSASPDWQLRWGMIALGVAGAPVTEELLFRGGAQQALKGFGCSRWVAILLSSLVFALSHAGVLTAGAAASGIATLFALSCVLGWLMERTGRIFAPMVAHAIFNGANFAILMAS